MPNKPLIWILEGDSPVESIDTRILSTRFQVRTFQSVQELSKETSQESPDVILIDIKETLSTEVMGQLERLFTRKRRRRPSGMKNLVLDPTELSLKNDGQILARFTPKELQIFSVVYEARGAAVSREKIILRVWPDTPMLARSLDVHLSSIRKKIAKAGLAIRRTGDPRGYRLTSVE